MAFAVMMPITLALGVFMLQYFRPLGKVHMLAKHGAFIVTFGWIFAAFLGMMPYLLAGTFDNIADAFF